MQIYVETSAIVGILLEEPDAEDLLSRLHSAKRRMTSVVNKIEAALSIGKSIRDYQLATKLVADFLEMAEVEVLGITPDIYDDVLLGYGRYGKGAGHPAKLNFGDCFSYAIAKRTGFPLLSKGNDFVQTDLVLY